VLDGNFQQIDLLPSLTSIASEEFCRSSFAGHFLLPTRQPASCLLHARGDDRDMVYYLCGDDEGLVKIDGEETRIVLGETSEASRIVDKINHDRSAR
jgi:hypothetical protein